MKLIVRWAIVAIALVAAAWVIPGIRVDDSRAWVAVVVMAAILGLVNAFVRPILKLLSCGCIVLTLGFFLLVVNAFTLWLASRIAVDWFNVGFHIDGFWPAFWGGIVVSIVSFALNTLLADRTKESSR